MSISLLLIMLLTWAVALRMYGPFSFVCAGVFCFTVYSIPALLGLVFPFTEVGPLILLARASQGAVDVTVLAWAVFCMTLAIPVVKRGPRHVRTAQLRAHAASEENLGPFVAVALCMCLAGFTYLAFKDGALFFLDPRNEQSDDMVRLLWRWINAVGLLAAVLARRWWAAGVFFAAALVYFLAGDRTVIVIVAFCLFVVAGRGRSIGILLRPPVALAVICSLAVAVLGKPIFLVVKAGSLDILRQSVTADSLSALATTFEPFATFNILDLVVRHGFEFPGRVVFEGALGQLLIVPSMFGVDSSSFNYVFTRTFAPGLSYGIAANYWAQAWAVASAPGVVIYAFIYAAGLRLGDRLERRQHGASRVLVAMIAALLAVYVHRNSLDNLLSLVRQIALVVGAIALIAKAIEPFFGRRVSNAGATYLERAGESESQSTNRTR